jgi:hypothetical protein
MIAGVTPAEMLLKLYDEKGKNIDHIFNEILYWTLVAVVAVLQKMLWLSCAHVLKAISSLNSSEPASWPIGYFEGFS